MRGVSCLTFKGPKLATRENLMNFLYFACCDCKIYIDAGYRWAWELLSQDIVAGGELINVEAVLGAKSYWNPPRKESSRWLFEEVFPPLRRFFEEHKSHRIMFGEQDEIAPVAGFDPDWMQIGYLLTPTPRYLFEVLGLRSWEQVRLYMEKQEIPPVWWEVTWGDEPSPREQGRLKFEELVTGKYGS
jgi:hypothetical protein